ncbi:hypothetical protein, partial [Polymorphospora rubra]|uniref:hypothetical protein n=1 Tax=Polymorphospora rubra TaxID=338584 RepID=UPI0031E33267
LERGQQFAVTVRRVSSVDPENGESCGRGDERSGECDRECAYEFDRLTVKRVCGDSERGPGGWGKQYGGDQQCGVDAARG